MRPCSRCGRSFFADVHWKTLCYACWKETRAQPAALPSRAERQRIRELEIRLKLLAELLPDEHMVRVLLGLCHPDKHNGSAHANEATRWLLELRKRLGLLDL